jgi:hypothetical protein
MTEDTSSGLQQAAYRTFLWLLDPAPEEAGKAYARLFERLTGYIYSSFERPYFVLWQKLDVEDLAERALTKTAEFIYLSLSKSQFRNQSDRDAYDKIPPPASPEEYEAARKNIWGLARKYARRIALEAARNLRRGIYIEDLPGGEDALPEPHDQSAEIIDRLDRERRLKRVRSVLNTLSPTDRYIIENYFETSREREHLARRMIASELGITTEILRRHVARIRQKVVDELSRPSRAEAEFTAYFPPNVCPPQWSTLLAYMHVSEALSKVDSDSKRRFGIGGDQTKKRSASKNVAIERGANILVMPQSSSLEFNPPRIGFVWREDYHCAEFRLRLREDVEYETLDNQIAVRVAFFVLPLLIADITFSLNLSQAASFVPLASATVRPYQRVFVSYSHKDSDIANQLEKAYSVLGIEYLRDVRMLRSGEEWETTLLQRIEESEVFQLLWSEAAKCSANVQKEWQHALSLSRKFFIRPVYWERPMPQPPPQLADIHFAYLDLRRNRHL